MNLVIVESPTKARTLSRFLGNDYQIMASMGHVRDLPKSKLGVDVAKNFAPDYQIVEDKQATVNELIQKSKKAKKIFLATDPDREGEAIAYHVEKIIKENLKKLAANKFSRITFHEITKSAIQESLKNPGAINMRLVDSQQARRVLDRLVGYNLSPLLWRKVRKGLSAGRVQSVAVRLIVEREEEIKAFKAKEFWIITAVLSKLKDSKKFEATLLKIKEKKIEVKTATQAAKIVKELTKSEYQVKKVTKKRLNQAPPPPFITSTLQRNAVNLFSWSSKKTMRHAQQLYENGFITYHRTDSLNLAASAIKKAREFISKKYGDKYLPEKPRVFKTKSKLAQEAHEAIRPTNVSRDETKIEARIGKVGLKLYQLIKKRFLASQMSVALVDKTIIDIEAEGKYQLRASGEIQQFAGWKTLYKSDGKTFENQIQLPEVQEKETLQLIKVLKEQKFTQPPARYSESSLIKTLEKLGIGRPSTYAPTISTILNRKYTEKKEGKFEPTNLGIAVNEFLEKYFTQIMDYTFTAQMEDDLDKVAQGERKWKPLIAEFYKPFAKKVDQVKKKAKRVKIATEKTGNKCPECGKGDEVIRLGRFGKFLSCSRFPKCKYTKNYVEKFGASCPECHKGEIVIKHTKKNRQFYGCSNYPQCKWASWRKPKIDN